MERQLEGDTVADRMAETLDLVRSAQGGEQQALEDLLGRYSPRVLKIVRLRMGPKLRQRLESVDVLQEVFAAAVRNFDRFEMRDEGSLIHWFGKIVERRIRSAAEKQGAQRRDVNREVAFGAMARSDGETDVPGSHVDPVVDTLVPLDKAIRNEEIEQVESCVQELPDQYRELILMRNYAGMSFSQIAEETGRPSEGAARMMHAKAMIELARQVRHKNKEKGQAEDKDGAP